MKKSTLLPIVIILTSLIVNSQNLQINRITYKWNAQRSDVNMCEECEINSKDCCVINYLSKRYLKHTSYQFDKEGKVINIYSYHVPLGVNVYSLEEYVNIFPSDTKVKTQKIYWDKENKLINDSGKIIKKFQIDSTQNKLYLLVSDKLTIYEYE